MPVGVLTQVQERKDLKTLPEAFVIVRRMDYGERLARGEMATRLFIEGSKSSNDVKGEIDIQQRTVTLWDFANLIVEHNITDENNRPLNFKDPRDVSRLDGRIGEEIGKYIDEFNQFEEIAEVKNS